MHKIGIEPVTTSTTATAAIASPILASVAIFLKDVLKEAQPALTQISTELLVKKAQDAAAALALNKNEKELIAQQQVQSFNAAAAQQATSTTVNKFLPIALVAGAGIGIYLIAKKKRR